MKMTHQRGMAQWVSSIALGAALLVACGGAAPEAETAPASSEVEETPPATEPPPPAPESTEDETPAPEPATSAEPVTPQEFQNALQVVIQDDAFLTALKLEEPGRFPLKIAGEGLPVGLELTAVDKGVEVVPMPEDPKKQPVLVFLKIDLNSERGTFKYRYDVEGVRGTSRVARDEGAWILKSSRISAY